MVERRSRACSDTSASYLLLWPLFMHDMPPLFSTPRTATRIMHTSHTIHLKLSTLHYFRYQHLRVSIYKLVHPHSTHCIPETYFWSLCTLHTGLIMSTAICYLCYIKQCLGRGRSLGGRALFLLFIHTGGDYGGEGGLGRCQPVTCSNMYIVAAAWVRAHTDKRNSHLWTEYVREDKHKRKSGCEIAEAQAAWRFSHFLSLVSGHAPTVVHSFIVKIIFSLHIPQGKWKEQKKWSCQNLLDVKNWAHWGFEVPIWVPSCPKIEVTKWPCRQRKWSRMWRGRKSGQKRLVPQ